MPQFAAVMGLMALMLRSKAKAIRVRGADVRQDLSCRGLSDGIKASTPTSIYSLWKTMALTVDDTSHLGKFKAQYLQLLDLDELSWPSSSTLRKSSAQEWLFKNLFDRMQLQYLPNDRYQARALKRLLELINGAIEDPNEDVRIATSRARDIFQE